MDLLEIADWEVFNRQPAEIIDWRLAILEERGKFQAGQVDRVKKANTTNVFPTD